MTAISTRYPGRADASEANDLKSAGLKATLPRMQVLEIIRNSTHRHLSAEDVFRRVLDQGLDVGLATVYRVLSQLEGAGLLSRNVFDGGKAVFEINEGHHHDHLICVVCGRAVDLPVRELHALIAHVRRDYAIEIDLTHFSLMGRCLDCGADRNDAPGHAGPPDHG